jgi:glycosyltransferase involved in cell wall biosynthesis
MKPVRVGIDISPVPFGRGVSRYTSNIITALAARSDIEMSLFGAVGRQWSSLRDWVGSLRGNPAYRALPVPTTLLEKAWQMTQNSGFWYFAPRAEVIHVWEWQTPPVLGKPWVVTIHDLAHLLFPETAHPEVVRRFEAVLARVEQDPLAHVIAISQSTKNDIVRLTSIDPERITVIYESLPQEARYSPSKKEVSQTLQKFGLKRPYFLFVGTSEPRKNLVRVVAAWQKVSQPNGIDLVLAGAKGWENLPQVYGLRELGYVESAELACLYRGATGLVFPSMYEGFGLPVLEAFFHGCPVLTSRVSSLPEVAGSAAILVDPYSDEAVQVGLKKLQTLSSLQKLTLQKKMRAQLGNFSWDTAAEQTLEVYRKARNV